MTVRGLRDILLTTVTVVLGYLAVLAVLSLIALTVRFAVTGRW